jgi:dTMP kinase
VSLFITFEGLDGSGKTTQIQRTAAWLSEQGYDVLVKREPGGTELGEAIRDILLDHRWSDMTPRTEYLLYSASRAQLVEEIVKPHLAKPRAVMILDRYHDSSTAYQGGGRELGIEAVEAINKFVTEEMIPAVTLFLDVDWPTCVARRKKANATDDRLESSTREFFERVRAAYLELCERHPQRIVRIDAAQSEDEVFRKITEELRIRLSNCMSAGNDSTLIQGQK